MASRDWVRSVGCWRFCGGWQMSLHTNGGHYSTYSCWSSKRSAVGLRCALSLRGVTRSGCDSLLVSLAIVSVGVTAARTGLWAAAPASEAGVMATALAAWAAMDDNQVVRLLEEVATA